jgi:hypothetical protein
VYAGDCETFILEYDCAKVMDGSNQKKWKLFIFCEKEKIMAEVISVNSTLFFCPLSIFQTQIKITLTVSLG